MRVDVATIFPELFVPFVSTSIVGRAVRSGVADLRVHNLRDYTSDRHRKADDYPYGGGPGMVMKAEPFFRFVDALRSDPSSSPHVVLMTPRGEPYRQATARRLAQVPHLALLCGHYKGVDARVDTLADEEISLGDFVISGGEFAAMAVVDSVVRLLPGAVHDKDSVDGDSHEAGLLACPEYTRPEEFRGLRVPEVLVGGHHAKIEVWRHGQSVELTRRRRPDLHRAWEEAGDREGKRRA